MEGTELSFPVFSLPDVGEFIGQEDVGDADLGDGIGKAKQRENDGGAFRVFLLDEAKQKDLHVDPRHPSGKAKGKHEEQEA